MLELIRLADEDLEKPIAEIWAERVAAALEDGQPVIRRLGLRAMPNPVVGDFVPLLETTLADSDPGVLGAAAELAGRSGEVRPVGPLLQSV